MDQASNEKINHAVETIRTALGRRELDHAKFLEQANRLLPILEESGDGEYTEQEKQAIFDKYEMLYGSKTYAPGVTLTADKTSESWLYKKKANMSPEDHAFESRYKQYLYNVRKYTAVTIDYIMQEAEHVLSLCADPDAENLKKGLVMGDVQSGKTSNYLALANMACDYGYQTILILSGLTESLRIQTQQRTDEGLIGAKSSSISGNEIQLYEIGLYGDEQRNYAIPLTSDEKDFDSMSCTPADLNKPQIFVVKKNKSILENVISWLKPGQNVSSKNILIIDDECDNASVNTKKDESNPTKINGLIRTILNKFGCATYVGYSATPFANIFIKSDDDPDYVNLFPSDFIFRLKTTDDSYFGAKKVFSGDDSPFITFLDDKEPNFLPAKHSRYDEVRQLPDSLKNAICMFLICNCIRTLRGDKNQHRSMLVNISYFNDVQESILFAIERYIKKLTNYISAYDKKPLANFRKMDELERIYQVYQDEMFDHIREEVDFFEIKSLLEEEIKKFEVLIVNSRTRAEDGFDYLRHKDDGARYIIIGGYALSRGLTLEGLMTSYFNRNSTAYDTLLQMCRWFGYRPGYEDLCKIYMTRENYASYLAVVDAISNFDNQLERMAVLGLAPINYGLMIKEDPALLNTKIIATAPSKSRHSKIVEHIVRYEGEVIDTDKLSYEAENVINNDNVVKNFVRELYDRGFKIQKIRNRYMFKDLPYLFIADFVSNLKILPYYNRNFDVSIIEDFIRKAECYKAYDVVFATGVETDEKYKLYDSNGEEILCINPVSRSSYVIDEDIKLLTFFKGNNRMLDPGIFDSGLTDEQLARAKEAAASRVSNKEGKIDMIASDYLSIRERNPLVVILPVKLGNDSKKDSPQEKELKSKIISQVEAMNANLLAFGIGFPEMSEETKEKGKVRYRMNEIKFNQYINDLGGDDEDYE